MPSLAEWGEIASPVSVGIVAVIQGLWILSIRANDKAKAEQASQDHDDNLAMEIKRLSDATVKLGDGLDKIQERQEKHETKDAIFEERVVGILGSVQKALEAVTPNATAIALLQQTQATQAQQIAYGTDQFQRIEHRFEEVFRGLNTLWQGKSLPHAYRPGNGDEVPEPKRRQARRRPS